MLNGLWHTHFVAGPAHGDGMAVLRDGEILGGDPTYTYTGSYRLDGAFLYANVRREPLPSRRAFGCFGGPSDIRSEGFGGRGCREPVRTSKPIPAARKLRTSPRMSTATLTVVVEPVDGELSVLTDLNDVAVGITHVAAPFPPVRIG